MSTLPDFESFCDEVYKATSLPINDSDTKTIFDKYMKDAFKAGREKGLDEAVEVVDEEYQTVLLNLREESPGNNNHLWSAYSGACDSLLPVLTEIKALKEPEGPRSITIEPSDKLLEAIKNQPPGKIEFVFIEEIKALKEDKEPK